MKKLIGIIWFIALLVLHQDFWNWDRSDLLFDFLPIGLAYHAALSILAAGLGAWACFKCWPKDLEDEVLSASEESA
jgi:hypothetical protein